jgi:hypothetical protein
LAAASIGRAAPPAVTSLFPAGAQRGTSVEVAAAGTFERWPVQAWASDRGVEVRAGHEKGKLFVTVAADAAPGVYWLRLFDEQGASAPRPFLVGTLPEASEQEPNDDPKAPQRINEPGATVNGRLQKPGDMDGFAVQLRRGQTLVAALEANATLRSPMDAVLQVVSPDGFVLATGHDHRGLDPFLAVPVPKDGTYTVRAFTFPEKPDSSIRYSGADTYIYRLTVTAGGYAEYPFPLAVSRFAPGTVEVVGWNVPAAARRLPVWARPGADEAVLWHADLANPVPVRVEPHACVVKPPGAEPFPLAVPMTATGRIETPGTADTYSFTAAKGDKLVIRADSRTLNLPLTLGLRLADDAGAELARAEPKGVDGDPELAFSPPNDGTYRLTVRDLYGDGGPRAAYRLRVTRADPDFALSVKADRFTVEAGKALDIPVAVQRLNGFAGEFEIDVQGLTPGVEVAPSAGGKDKGTVTLKLTAASDAAGSGPIRIVGRAKSEPDLVRPATAPLSEFGVTTTDLWLTVTKPAAKGPATKRK